VSLLLGLDTGGTYTDAVLFDPARGVVASAKALTTKHDLALGLRDAIDGVLPQASEPLGLVSLSTTLATNAIVEGHGSPICLLLVGYEPAQLDRAGLRQALGSDPVEFLAGGHNPLGDEQQPLDFAAAEQAVLRRAPNVAAFAVSGFFSVRNPAHENAVKALIRERTGLPVTCGHELTSKLDAPRRALTAALNARLIPQLKDLIEAVQKILAERAIRAPLMIVKGDGSLIAAEVALGRPVETILSGPAASVVGAHYLAKTGDVVVSDMGGTTTDVAMLREGRPMLNREGAVVGGWRTMVEAVAVHSYGLGGDSELHLGENGLALGPRRAVPLSLLAAEHGSVLGVLADQAEDAQRIGYDGQFAVRLRRLSTGRSALDPTQARLWDRIEAGPLPLSEAIDGPQTQRALNRLMGRGLVAISAFTPSDAAHALGLQAGWSAAAAELGARIWLRRLDALGVEKGIDGVAAFCRRVIEQAVRQSVRLLVETAVMEETGISPDEGGALARLLTERMAAGDGGRAAFLDLRLPFKLPLVAIGAPVGTYYPAIAERLGTSLVIPPHAAVCNAVGAVAGGVLKRVEALVTQPYEGRFRVHLPSGNRDFGALEDAVAHAGERATELARAEALAAGADAPEVSLARADKVVENLGGLRIFVESRVAATAFGRPRIGKG